MTGTDEIYEICKARGSFYAFLSRMFTEEPTLKLVQDMASGRFPFPETSFNEECADGVRLLKGLMKAERDVAKMYEQLCCEYTRLFIGPVPAMFPYESMYIDGSMMSKSLLDVKKEYRRAGVSRSRSYPEPEDHIAMELAFMSYLCHDPYKESLAMQREFLHDHLLKWVPRFCDDLCDKTTSDFFRGIGKLAKGFLIMEKDVVEELVAN